MPSNLLLNCNFLGTIIKNNYSRLELPLYRMLNPPCKTSYLKAIK